jgi:ubiquinone/menaquinone biosynthesis C-methylase UbiE
VSFDRVAPYYRLLETIAFGQALQRARVYWIDKVSAPKRALIVGEGNGRFLCELLRIYPNVTVDCIDASKEMLKLSRARVLATRPESLAQVCFLHQDILNWSPRDSYDLLVTHFFLDCFRRNEMKTIIDKLACSAMPSAAWLLADFTPPTGGIFVRIHSKLLVRTMYLFFRLAAGITATDLVDPTPYLQANGFVHASRRLSRARMVKSELFVSNQLA